MNDDYNAFRPGNGWFYGQSAWESMSNPDFNYGEFAIIKSKAGLNNIKIKA